ncbi:MAG: DUF4224 domain-containing protein [Candidatus Thiodiazotropha sp. (ex Lucinoma kastoroae)]|nr:DUF4224 domain-containing protein [Candidatus Thiodiazotropha sp. (ex Lucinoma kastoroae)]
MFLNPQEVAELTGYQGPKRQIKWLIANEYPYEVGGDKQPKVLRSLVVSRLGGMVEHAPQEPKLHLT